MEKFFNILIYIFLVPKFFDFNFYCKQVYMVLKKIDCRITAQP